MSDRPNFNKITIDKDHPVHPWHPLDHHIGSRYCLSFQGRRSIKIHWNYYRDFKMRHDFWWFFRATRCWWGKHHYRHWQSWRNGGHQEWDLCEDCGRKKET